ncbi:MAG: cation:proton antiporter [Planctomycetota bacterium]|nr:cation:proton antiporter [Planctomycetota bacterium]
MKIICRIGIVLLGLAILAPPAYAAGGGSITHSMMMLVLQLAVILFAAKLLGAFFDKVLRMPSVLGELAAGMGIGPYVLGALPLPGIGPLFPLPEGADFPISHELWGIATLGSIVLLFLIGLETDFKKFFRFFLPGTVVGIGGVVGSFFLGDLLTVYFSVDLFGETIGFMDYRALFMGTISTATSVGITARVLSDMKKLDSEEGTTILAGAVIDDVLGIIILAVVLGIADAHKSGDPTRWADIGRIAAVAFGFWIVATVAGLLLARPIARFLKWVPSTGATVALGFGFALFLAGLAESAGLAMIIGAYVMGLSLSKEDISHDLERELAPVYHILVPIFFAVMGMLVDFSKMGGLLTFGAIYTAAAIVGKVLGGGLPVLAVGFNLLGAWRVGIGMLPRGEVALIMAGIGLANGLVNEKLFGVAILMTVVTTLIAPPILVQSFKNPRSGLRKKGKPGSGRPPLERVFAVPDLDASLRRLVVASIISGFEDEGFTVKLLSPKQEIYQIAMEDTFVEMNLEEDAVYLHTQPEHQKKIKGIAEACLDSARKRAGDLKLRVLRMDEDIPSG